MGTSEIFFLPATVDLSSGTQTMTVLLFGRRPRSLPHRCVPIRVGFLFDDTCVYVIHTDNSDTYREETDAHLERNYIDPFNEH